MPYERVPQPAARANYDEDYDTEIELEENLPYGIQNVRSVPQQQDPQPKVRSLRTKPMRQTRVKYFSF